MSKNIEISKLYPDPNQPRQSFPKDTMLELKRSIKKQGILNPILVESNYKGDNYLIIDGERRYRCAIELNLKNVPIDIIEGPLSIAERTIKRFHVQGLTSDWNYFDKARAIYHFRKETNYTLMKIADTLGIHLPKVHGLLSLIELSDESQKTLIDKKIPFNYSFLIIRLIKCYEKLLPEENKENIEKKIINKIITEKLTVAQLNILNQIVASPDNNRDKIKYILTDDQTIDNLIEATKEGNKKSSEMFSKFLTQTRNSLNKYINKNLLITTEIEQELKAIENIIKNFKK
jgi:ParB family transcriptional regulator, chromosome partitioning protein